MTANPLRIMHLNTKHLMNDDSEKKKHQKVNSASKLTPPEKAHIEELLKSALNDYATRQKRIIKDKEVVAENLVAIITEYIGPFLLIGYDMQGEPFNIMNATSQMDADAIATAVNKFIFNCLSNNQ